MDRTGLPLPSSTRARSNWLPSEPRATSGLVRNQRWTAPRSSPTASVVLPMRKAAAVSLVPSSGVRSTVSTTAGLSRSRVSTRRQVPSCQTRYTLSPAPLSSRCSGTRSSRAECSVGCRSSVPPRATTSSLPVSRLRLVRNDRRCSFRSAVSTASTGPPAPTEWSRATTADEPSSSVGWAATVKEWPLASSPSRRMLARWTAPVREPTSAVSPCTATTWPSPGGWSCARASSLPSAVARPNSDPSSRSTQPWRRYASAARWTTRAGPAPGFTKSAEGWIEPPRRIGRTTQTRNRQTRATAPIVAMPPMRMQAPASLSTNRTRREVDLRLDLPVNELLFILGRSHLPPRAARRGRVPQSLMPTLANCSLASSAVSGK